MNANNHPAIVADGKQHIYNLIIIDESESMSSIESETVQGIQETINSIRQAQKSFGDKQTHYLSLVTFDSPGKEGEDVRTLIDCQPIDQVRDFKQYNPEGCTPLYDAMGISITRLESIIRRDEDGTAIVTIITDGYENSSSQYTASQIKELIERLKGEGWTFNYMGSDHDVQSVIDTLSIDVAVSFKHDGNSTRNTWDKECASRMRYFRQMYEEEEFLRHASKEERMKKLSAMAQDYNGGRVTPAHISRLNEDEIFVFGSNAQGRHHGGAALAALRHFGAVYGQGSGLQGQSYAIPTVGVSYEEMKHAVSEFVEFAQENPDKIFFVTAIGCGNAGIPPRIMAPLFRDAVILENVTLPVEFWKELGLNF